MTRPSRSKVSATCEHCGATFPVFPWELSRARFCSRDCRYAPRPIAITGDIALVPLTRGLVATIDAADVPLVEGRNWYASSQGGKVYARSRNPNGGTPEYLHRVILDTPGGVADHISGDTLDNRRANLRVGTQADNLMNRVGWKGRDLPKGVYRTRQGRYSSKIARDGVTYNLGTFDTIWEASLAYDVKARDLHGEHAHLNQAAHR